MKTLKIWIVILALPSLAFTNCSDFNDVVVPVSDSASPAVGFRIGPPGGPSTVKVGDASDSTSNYSGQWLVAPGGRDTGGMEELRVLPSWSSNCSASPIAGFFDPSTFNQGPASPGDTVSDGIYLFKYFRPSDFISNPACSLTYRVTVIATDYAGNENDATYTFTYSP